MSKSQLRRIGKKAFKSWHTCSLCAYAVGGRMPPNSCGITMTIGTCPDCGKKGTTLIPLRDFDWPKTGEKAWFD